MLFVANAFTEMSVISLMIFLGALMVNILIKRRKVKKMLLKAKIFSCANYAGYKEEESAFNEFLEDIQKSDEFLGIEGMHTRLNSIIVTYYYKQETKKEENLKNENTSYYNQIDDYFKEKSYEYSCDMNTPDNVKIDYNFSNFDYSK